MDAEKIFDTVIAYTDRVHAEENRREKLEQIKAV